MSKGAGLRATVAAILTLATVASCSAFQRAASTTELSVTHGETSSSGRFDGSIGSGRADFAGTTHESGDFDAVSLSIHPLAALDTRQDRTNELLERAVAKAYEPPPAPPAPFAAASIVHTADGRTVLVHDGKAEILDPLEPLRARAPTTEDGRSSQAGAGAAERGAASIVTPDVWATAGTIAALIAGVLGTKRYHAAHEEAREMDAPRPSVFAAVIKGRRAARRGHGPREERSS